MTFLTLIELGRATGEAARTVLARSPGPASAEEAAALMEFAVEIGRQTEKIADTPHQILADAGGREASGLAELCRSVLEVINLHIVVLESARQLATETARVHSTTPPDPAALAACHATLLRARARNAELLAKLTAPPKPINWEQLQKNLEALDRGEKVRLNPYGRK